jgi:hypothetical protein
VLTIYVAGLAAECLFRAFRAQKGLAFRSDHSLEALSRDAGFPGLIPSADRTRFDAALVDMILGWQNSHRFCSENAIRTYIKRRGLDRGVKGDAVKELARRLSSGAVELVQLGVMQWTK